MSRVLPMLCLVAIASLLGCGSNPLQTYAIPGKLVYEDNSPVPGASVVLQTTVGDQVVSALGMAGPDGKFQLTTFKNNDGVVAGEHLVAISPLPAPDGVKPTQPPVHSSYWDFSTSGLKTTVTPQTPEIVITLSRTGGK